MRSAGYLFITTYFYYYNFIILLFLDLLFNASLRCSFFVCIVHSVGPCIAFRIALFVFFFVAGFWRTARQKEIVDVRIANKSIYEFCVRRELGAGCASTKFGVHRYSLSCVCRTRTRNKSTTQLTAARRCVFDDEFCHWNANVNDAMRPCVCLCAPRGISSVDRNCRPVVECAPLEVHNSLSVIRWRFRRLLFHRASA